MKIDVDGLTVYFPYDYVYPEQYHYMRHLKRALDAKGHGVLEMPTGTGKTITVLALVTSYQLARQSAGKLVYCTRTVQEMEKALDELKRLMQYRDSVLQDDKSRILGLGLSSRRNMCIHPTVSQETERSVVDARCRGLTAPWVRESKTMPTCEFFDAFEQQGSENKIPAGVYTLEDMRELGKERGWCPYYTARYMIRFANVLVYSYQYMIDPKISTLISREIEKESVVVFDEAHNIDNVCIEALSVDISRPLLDQSQRNLGRLRERIDRAKETSAERLQDEYRRLVAGIASEGVYARVGGELPATPVLPPDVVREAVPGNIRKAEHFVGFLKRFITFLHKALQSHAAVQEHPRFFLRRLRESTAIDAKSLRFCYDRLASLMTTLEITEADEYQGAIAVADFATLIGTYERGFMLILEPFSDADMPNVHSPLLQLSCLDASLALQPVLKRFNSVVLTSGTLSPLEYMPRILNFVPVVAESFPISLARNCLLPMIVARGSDQLPISSKFDMRSDPSVVRNYGALLVEMASVVPDGIVCFFTSYRYMEDTIATWNNMGLFQIILRHKLVFIETPDIVETSLALENYRRACDCGRGAVFFSVARGKVAEGIDFNGHYGRAVLIMGVPFQYTLSKILRARMEFLRENFQVRESDFLSFDAIRQAAQCCGRVLRSKKDYGIMVLADKRFARGDKRSKLPRWISEHLHEGRASMSTDAAVSASREFLTDMAQPLDHSDQLGVALWDAEMLQKHNRGIDTAPSRAKKRKLPGSV